MHNYDAVAIASPATELLKFNPQGLPLPAASAQAAACYNGINTRPQAPTSTQKRSTASTVHSPTSHHFELPSCDSAKSAATIVVYTRKYSTTNTSLDCKLPQALAQQVATSTTTAGSSSSNTLQHPQPQTHRLLLPRQQPRQHRQRDMYRGVYHRLHLVC